MGLETGTYVNDLVTTNPLAGDNVGEGDNHLRLIKDVLKNTFPDYTRPRNLPTVNAKTTTYTILTTDEEATIECDASGGAFTVTLPDSPSLGYTVSVVKTDSSANAITVSRAGSNTINGNTSRSLSAQYVAEMYTYIATNIWIAGSISHSVTALGIGIGSPDGTLHVHSGSAGAVTANSVADDLVVENSADAGISILCPTASQGWIAFGSPTTAARGRIKYDHTSDYLAIDIATAEQARLNGTGLGIGVTPAQKLHVLGTIRVDNATSTFDLSQSSTSTLFTNNGSGVLAFYTNSGERFRVTGTGAFGIGTNNPASTLHVESSGSTSLKIVSTTTGNSEIGVYDTTDGGFLLYAQNGVLNFAEANTSGGWVATRWSIDTAGKMGIGATSLLGMLHVDQSSTTGAVPVLYLDQADISEEFFEFATTIGTGNAIEAVGAKTLTTTHFLKCTVNGVGTRYIPLGTIA